MTIAIGIGLTPQRGLGLSVRIDTPILSSAGATTLDTGDLDGGWASIAAQGVGGVAAVSGGNLSFNPDGDFNTLLVSAPPQTVTFKAVRSDGKRYSVRVPVQGVATLALAWRTADMPADGTTVDAGGAVDFWLGEAVPFTTVAPLTFRSGLAGETLIECPDAGGQIVRIETTTDHALELRATAPGVISAIRYVAGSAVDSASVDLSPSASLFFKAALFSNETTAGARFQDATGTNYDITLDISDLSGDVASITLGGSMTRSPETSIPAKGVGFETLTARVDPTGSVIFIVSDANSAQIILADALDATDFAAMLADAPAASAAPVGDDAAFSTALGTLVQWNPVSVALGALFSGGSGGNSYASTNGIVTGSTLDWSVSDPFGAITVTVTATDARGVPGSAAATKTIGLRAPTADKAKAVDMADGGRIGLWRISTMVANATGMEYQRDGGAWVDLPAGWTYLTGLTNGVATAIKFRWRSGDVIGAEYAPSSVTPTAAANNNYTFVAQPSAYSRAAAPSLTGTWSAAGLTTTAARDALWAATALGALTLATGSTVTPQSDGGITHDATAFTLADGATAAQTFGVARAVSVANLLAVDGSKFTYARALSALTSITVDYTTGVMTVTATGGTRFVDFSFYAEALTNPTWFLRRNDALAFTITGTATGAGQLGFAIRGGASDADGTDTTYNADGDGFSSTTFGVGAVSYSGGVTVPAPRTIGGTGHGIRLRIGAGFAGTITLGCSGASPAAVETVTATLLGGVAPDAPLEIVGDGALSLGVAVSHVEIEGPAGATMIPATLRAGLDAPTDAHIYRVTTTSDSTGLGTLRSALTSGTNVNNPGDPTHNTLLTGPRVVVFDVAGVWNLASEIQVTRAKTYVAGQTAPAHVILRGHSVKIYANDVILRHLSCIPDPPSSVFEAQNSIGFGVIAGDGAGQSISRVWVDQWFIANWADQAPVAFTSGTYEINDCYFTNGMVAEGFKAPADTADLDSDGITNEVRPGVGWDSFEKHSHNLGMFFGARTRNNVFAGNIVAGCVLRTPQVKAATHTCVMGNYIHDHANRTGNLTTDRNTLRPAPIQISGTDDNGDLSSFAGGAAVTVIAEGNWIEPGRQTRQGGFSIAGSAIERGTSYATSGMTVSAWHGDNRWEAGGATGWTLANIINFENGSGGTQSLGPNNRAITPLSNGVNTTLTVPTLWTSEFPTYAGETRAFTLAHAGPRPNDPHTMMDRLKTQVAAQAAINANTTGARERIYRDETTDPSGPAAATDDFSGEIIGPTAWTPPASPFAAAANGFTNVENALEALNVALGGAPRGNVDRPVTTWLGGKLLVTSDGLVEWSEAPASHDPITVTVTTTAGDELVVTLVEAA